MNMIDVQDKLKNLSEDQLVKEMQAPSGTAPQFLVLSEITRRKRMRDSFQNQQAQPTTTIAEEAIASAGVPGGGIAEMARSMAPNSSMAQNTAAMPQQAMPEEQPVQGMYGGGYVQKMAGGSLVGKMSSGEPIVIGGMTYTKGPDGRYRNRRGDVLQTGSQDAAGIASLPYDLGESLAGYSAGLADEANAGLMAQDRANLGERMQGQRGGPATTGYTYPDVPVEDMTSMLRDAGPEFERTGRGGRRSTAISGDVGAGRNAAMMDDMLGLGLAGISERSGPMTMGRRGISGDVGAGKNVAMMDDMLALGLAGVGERSGPMTMGKQPTREEDAIDARDELLSGLTSRYDNQNNYPFEDTGRAGRRLNSISGDVNAGKESAMADDMSAFDKFYADLASGDVARQVQGDRSGFDSSYRYPDVPVDDMSSMLSQAGPEFERTGRNPQREVDPIQERVDAFRRQQALRAAGMDAGENRAGPMTSGRVDLDLTDPGTRLLNFEPQGKSSPLVDEILTPRQDARADKAEYGFDPGSDRGMTAAEILSQSSGPSTPIPMQSDYDQRVDKTRRTMEEMDAARRRTDTPPSAREQAFTDARKGGRYDPLSDPMANAVDYFTRTTEEQNSVDAIRRLQDEGATELQNPAFRKLIEGSGKTPAANPPKSGDITANDPDVPASPNSSTSVTGRGSGAAVGGANAPTSYEQELRDAMSRAEKRANQDKWMALAQVGMQLMSSKEPTLGGALGEAGIAGLQAYQKSRDDYEGERLGLSKALFDVEQRREAAMAAQRAAGAKASGSSADKYLKTLQDDLASISMTVDDIETGGKKVVPIPGFDDEFRELSAKKAAALRGKYGIGSTFDATAP